MRLEILPLLLFFTLNTILTSSSSISSSSDLAMENIFLSKYESKKNPDEDIISFMKRDRGEFAREQNFRTQEDADEFIEEQKRHFLQKEIKNERERRRREFEWEKQYNDPKNREEEWYKKHQSRPRRNIQPQEEDKKKNKLNDILGRFGINSIEFMDGVYELVVPSKPRDLWEGIGQAFQSAFYGPTVGLISLVSFPWIGYTVDVQRRQDNDNTDDENNNVTATSGSAAISLWEDYSGLIVGGLTGMTISTVSTLAGFASSFYQISVGIVQTPTALKAKWYDGKRWNANSATRWEYYSLEAETNQLFNMMEDQEKKKRKVIDPTYYQILDVNSNAP